MAMETSPAEPLGLELGSVEQPDGERADRDDPQDDERERDVRLALRIVGREVAHSAADDTRLSVELQAA